MADADDTFRALYPGLRRFAAVVGPIEIEPDDLVQAALERVLRRGSLADLDDPGAYLRRTIVNLAANERRGLGRWRRALARSVAESESAADPYPSDVADLMSLAPAVRAVLWLVDVEGYTFGDAARLLGCTETAARARASRGRRQLRFNIDAGGA